MTAKAITKNTLFYGDNLPILRDHIQDESIDLIYLDPPFNSNRSYNVLFKEEGGLESEAQISAFDDTWHWDKSAALTYHEIIQNAPSRIVDMIGALHSFIGENQMMAYLVMMTNRLVELHRILKSTGSLYLHCDPTASHYLKMILDTIFGVENFRNEIVWKRFNFHADANRFGRVTDRLLFYSKGQIFTFTKQREPFSQEYIDSKFVHTDPDGRIYRLDNLNPPGGRGPIYEFHGVTKAWRFTQDKMLKYEQEGKIYSGSKIPQMKRYLDELQGEAVHELWDDIPSINSQAKERLGYPTQKPQPLLERIIQASSKPGDFILDPFCGCGTAIAAAQKLNRHWIGIDITYLAISLQKYRLKDAFNIIPGKDYEVIGEPVDLTSSKQLAEDNRYQFQWWACGMIGAMPLGSELGDKRGKKGIDQGIDGKINFIDDAKGTPKSVMVQVKSGHVKSGDIRDLHGTVDRENAAIGVFITLEQPTSEMNKEALSAGYYSSELWQKDYPRIQILTVEQLFDGERIQMPPAHGTFKKAEKVKKSEGKQDEFGI